MLIKELLTKRRFQSASSHLLVSYYAYSNVRGRFFAVPVGDFQMKQTNAISAEMSVKEKDGFPAATHI